MAKIIRLTESDLARIVKRVIKEEQGNSDFTELEKELQDAVVGKPFQISIPGKKAIQFKIESASAPKGDLKQISKRTLTFDGKTGTYYNDQMNYDSSSEDIIVSYKCQTSSEKIQDVTTPVPVKFMNRRGESNSGTFSPTGANVIEKAWCQKVAPSTNQGLY
jgi:hypothetical protein